jgi:hypothetical protein
MLLGPKRSDEIARARIPALPSRVRPSQGVVFAARPRRLAPSAAPKGARCRHEGPTDPSAALPERARDDGAATEPAARSRLHRRRTAARWPRDLDPRRRGRSTRPGDPGQPQAALRARSHGRSRSSNASIPTSTRSRLTNMWTFSWPLVREILHAMQGALPRTSRSSAAASTSRRCPSSRWSSRRSTSIALGEGEEGGGRDLRWDREGTRGAGEHRLVSS